MTAILAEIDPGLGMHELDACSDPVCPWRLIVRQHMRAALEALAEQGMQFSVS